MDCSKLMLVTIYHSRGHWGYTEWSNDGKIIVAEVQRIESNTPEYIHKAKAAATMLGYDTLDIPIPFPTCRAVADRATNDLLGMFETHEQAVHFMRQAV